MPRNYRHHSASDCFIVCAHGVLTEDEFVSGVLRAQADSNYRTSVRRFSDHAHVDRFEVTEKALERLAGAGKLSPLGRHALLIYSPVGTSVFRDILHKLSSGVVREFCDREEALEWLNEGMPTEKKLTANETRRGFPL